MDWDRVVEGNKAALQRILTMLVAMAGLGSTPSSPLVGEDGSVRRGEAETLAGPGEGCEERGPVTLTRRLHRAILRQLRPLESATRRLIIVAARDLPVPVLPPSRPRKPEPDLKAAHAPLRSLGIAFVLSSADIARAAAEKRAAEKRAAARADRAPVLPMADPRKRFCPRRRYVPPHAAPRIIFFDGSIPHKLPPQPGPHDQIDATRLALRLAGIGRALSDLPAQAQRYVRWKARSAARKVGRVVVPRSPLRPGRAPGWRQRSKDEINEVLADMQYFAREVLRAPDTS